jgi:Flp pilus assembly protein TadD
LIVLLLLLQWTGNNLSSHLSELMDGLLSGGRDAARAAAGGAEIVYESTRGRGQLQQLLDVEPDNVHVLVSLGVLHTRLRQHDEATYAFTRATTINPSHAVAHQVQNVSRPAPCVCLV